MFCEQVLQEVCFVVVLVKLEVQSFYCRSALGIQSPAFDPIRFFYTLTILKMRRTYNPYMGDWLGDCIFEIWA